MDLTVVTGRIPEDLNGAYMRNGPNPQFEPLAFAYPMDGDGMIHAVYLQGGRARYKNRFVRTAGLEVERRANRAIYGSFTHPVSIDPSALLPGDSHSPIKNGAFVNVMMHGDHLLAVNEATTCYEMSMDLQTLGQWTAGSSQPIRMGAHNRRHPDSGDLYALEYSSQRPVVKFHRLNPSGLLVSTREITVDLPTMIHDFVLTQNHIVMLAGPAVFDAHAAQAGKPFMQWKPEIGMRIALIPLNGDPVRWMEGAPFFVYHFANGFERGSQIVVDYVHHHQFALTGGAPASLRRLTIDRTTRRFRTTATIEGETEFPRIDHVFEARPHRYVYLPMRTPTLTTADAPSASFNAIVRMDTETGRSTRHDLGNRLIGEAAFVPRPGRRHDHEGSGYLAAFVYDPLTRSSDFVLLDAEHVNDGPIAVVKLPQRVPQGLHGNWIPTM